ncbi:Mitogen-activated protein kinase 9 [Zea mays]|uniref:Mitogen-activated protein kinase 9 n=1 Tax=Zea mays TaxID=4577 RepID=A0A3L6EZY4_MAIZE|nr:Mitogen-activated protein kinase 9 [Zea mays]
MPPSPQISQKRFLSETRTSITHGGGSTCPAKPRRGPSWDHRSAYCFEKADRRGHLRQGQDRLFPLPALLLIGLQFLKIGNDASEFVGPLVLNLLIKIQIHIGNMWYTCFIYDNSEIDSTRWRGENSMFSQNAAYKAVDKIIQALRDPYFKGLARAEREPSCQPIRKVEFDFEHKRMSKEEIRELLFREILEYHPQLLSSYINGTERTTFLYPSVVDQFKKQFSHLKESGGNSPSVPTDRKHASLPRTTVVHSNPIPAKEQPLDVSSRVRPVSDDSCKNPWEKASSPGNVTRTSLTPQGLQAHAGCFPFATVGSVRVNGPVTDSRYPAHQQIPQAYGYRQMPARLDSTNPSQAMGGYTL